MNTTYGIVALACLVGLFVGGWLYGSGSHAEYLARLIIEKIQPPAKDEWMLPVHRRWNWGCGLSFVLLTSLVSVSYGFGVVGLAGALVLGVVGAIVAFGLGYTIGYQLAKPRGAIAPLLAEFGTRAGQRSASFAVAGDSEWAAAAQRLADWTTGLALNVPHLTLAELERYYTTFQVAQLIEDVFFYDPDFYEPGDNIGDLDHWLTNTDEMLYEHPAEARRVELLGEVRSTDEIVQRLHEPYEPVSERIRALVNRLKSDSSTT